MKRPVAFLMPAAAVLASTLLHGGPAAAAMQHLEERVVEKRLANGLKVILLPRRQSPTVSISMRFNVGAVDEEEGKTGLAHLLEHMMFKGTRTLGTRDWRKERPLRSRIEKAAAALDEARREEAAAGEVDRLARELRRLQEEARRYVVKDEIDAIYTANGAQGFNAGTAADLTTYTISLPSSRLELWARIESERLRDPVMREFYSERDVVIEERRGSFETDPDRKLHSLLLSTSFSAHPYRRPVIGWPGDVDFLTVADAEEFFRTYYAPNNAVLTAVGDLSTDGFFALVERYFGDIPPQVIPRRPITAEPPQEGERRAILEMEAQPQLMIGYHKPTLPAREDYVFDLIDGLLSGGRTSRLYRRLVREKQVALSVSSSNGSPGARFGNLFVIHAVPRYPHGAEDLEREIFAEIERLAEEVVPQEEIDRVKRTMKADLLRGLQSNAGLAGLLSYFETVAGGWRYLSTHLDMLDDIGPEEIRETARRFLQATNRSVVTLATREKGSGAE